MRPACDRGILSPVTGLHFTPVLRGRGLGKATFTNRFFLLSSINKMLQKVTGWKPEISFDRMLDDLLSYWRVHGV